MRRFRRLFLKYVVAFALVAGFNFSFILILLEWTEQYTTMTLSFVCVLFTSLGLGEIFPSRASSSTSSEFPSRVSSETPGTGPSLPNGNGLVSFMLQVFRRFDERLLFWYITTSRLLFVATVLLLNASRFGERDLFSKFTKCDKITPNPDIVGSGVRCSMYILLLFVFASLLVATFHRQQSGTKELGCFVLINLCAMSLSLAMAKPDSITPTDYLAVVLMIDTQCVALSATLSSKDALASRESILRRAHAARPGSCLGGSCVYQPHVCELVLASHEWLHRDVLAALKSRGCHTFHELQDLLVLSRARSRSFRLVSAASHISIRSAGENRPRTTRPHGQFCGNRDGL